VDLWRIDRRTLSWCRVALPWLALCVFTWGVQYKLSLYDPPQAVSHQMPQAKLLSREQRATSDENPLLMSSKATNRATRATLAGRFSFFLLAPSLLSTPALRRSQFEENRPWHPHRPTNLNTFLRPPPPPTPA
jgi:hypothetical protein